MSLPNALDMLAQAAGLIASGTQGPVSHAARIVRAAAGVGAGLARSGVDADGIVERITAVRSHGAGAVDERVDAGVSGLPSEPEPGSES